MRTSSDHFGSERRGLLLILGAALLWSTGGVAIKAVDAGPLVISFYRSAIAAVALFIVVRPAVKRWTKGFIIAAISYAACLTTFVIATKLTTAANAIFLQYMGVVWVVILSPFTLGERARTRDVVTAAVALGGMALFFLEEFDPRGMAGNISALFSSVFFALLILALRSERDASAEAAVSWGNVIVAVSLAPFVARDLAVGMTSFSLLFFLGVFQIAIAYYLFVRGLRTVTATQASLTGMIEPVMNPIWVLLFLGERPSKVALAGGAIVLGAVTVRTLMAPEKEVVPPPPD